MKLDNLKRIVKEEFAEEFQEVIEKLGYILNPFMESVVNLSNGRVDFDNLNQELVTIKVSVNSLGLPIVDTKFATKRLQNSNGGHVIRVQNVTTPGAFVIGSPFVSFVSVAPGLFKVNHITGLAPDTQYLVTLNVIGK